MFKLAGNVLSKSESRSLLLLTLISLAVYRLGFSTSLPFVNQKVLAETLSRQGNNNVLLVGNSLSLLGVMAVLAVTIAAVWVLSVTMKIARSNKHDV